MASKSDLENNFEQFAQEQTLKESKKQNKQVEDECEYLASC